MKCAGAHIGGHGITYDTVEYIVDKGEELSRNWQALVSEFDYPQKDGFYFLRRDEGTGLNTREIADKTSRGRVPLIYRLSRVAHSFLFNEKSVLFRMLRPLASGVDASRRAKRLFGCLNCGDCALFDVAYVCPMSQCSKQQRNGPCGGSHRGWCEVYPEERQCIWVQAYDRLKAFGEQAKLEEYIVPPCNWRLWETSSWLNFYLGRDHMAERLGISPPAPRRAARGRAEAP